MQYSRKCWGLGETVMDSWTRAHLGPLFYLVSWHIAMDVTPSESSPIWQFSLLDELNCASRIRFFCFILLFWNHILTCVSLSPKEAAISILRARVRYLLKWNSFSSSVSCLLVKFVRPMLAPAPPWVGVWAVG